MSLLCKEFIIYFSHLIIAIDIDWQVKYCQFHFSNGETEAQQKHIAKRWDQSPNVTINVLSIPVFSFPAGCLKSSTQAEKAHPCMWFILRSSVDELQSMRLPSRLRNLELPEEELVSQALISGNI